MTDLERARAFWLQWHGYITSADDVKVAALAEEFACVRDDDDRAPRRLVRDCHGASMITRGAGHVAMPDVGEDAGWQAREQNAAVEKLVDALLAVEWTEQVREGGACWRECPGCRSDKRQLTKDGRGHAADCPIDTALTGAGFPDQARRDVARKRMAKP